MGGASPSPTRFISPINCNLSNKTKSPISGLFAWNLFGQFIAKRKDSMSEVAKYVLLWSGFEENENPAAFYENFLTHRRHYNVLCHRLVIENIHGNVFSVNENRCVCGVLGDVRIEIEVWCLNSVRGGKRKAVGSSCESLNQIGYGESKLGEEKIWLYIGSVCFTLAFVFYCFFKS